MATVRTILCAGLLFIAVVNAELLLKDGKVVGKKRVITNTCSLYKKARVDENCMKHVSYALGKDSKTEYLMLSEKRHQWEVLKAKEGGYHIRTCKKDDCKYWLASEKNGWDWMTLSDKPVSRFEIKKVHDIEHQKTTEKSVMSGEVVSVPNGTPPVKKTAYKIVSLTSGNYNYVTYDRYEWLINDDSEWYWLFQPQF